MINNFSPINKNSEKIFRRKDYALVAISPFNSYFSLERIILLIDYTKNNFNNFSVFLPDEISRFNLEALGYSEEEAQQKVKKHDNYIRNKVIKALTSITNCSEDECIQKIMNMSKIFKKPNYMKFYNFYKEKFDQDKEFRNGCLETSFLVLKSNAKLSKIPIDENAKHIAVQYFLYELPVYLNMSEILEIDSCLYVYHSISDFLRELYFDSSMTSSTQGFLILEVEAINVV